MTRITFLSKEDKISIHTASLEVLEKTGVLIKNENAIDLLSDAGCVIEDNHVKFPPSLVEECLHKPPSSFKIYSRDGSISHLVGENNVLFNPGSSVTYFRDNTSMTIRKGTIADLEKIVCIVEALDNFQAQSTALIPNDIPEVVSDFYRLYIILKNSSKPIITGAFRKKGLHDMLRLLEVIAGNSDVLAKKPRAIFDCCPSSPLVWSDVPCQNLIDCASSGVPAEIVPAPLIGATSPVTIIGTVIQTNVEILSGIVIAQLVNSGSPVIYGGAPAVFDQRYATPRYGAMEAMISACASAEMGKHYGIPTHAYLGLSDSKIEDAQSGFESGLGIVLGTLAEINIISGPGALAYINMQSLEKLVIDNELCGSAYRLAKGLELEDMHMLTELISKVGPGGDYLGQRHTAKNLRLEHFMPSDIIDRLSTDSWIDNGSKSIHERAKRKVLSILQSHTPVSMQEETEHQLDDIFQNLLMEYGSDKS